MLYLSLAWFFQSNTVIVSVTTFDSVEDLDGMIQSGMESGATETWDRLEELVEEMGAEIG